MNIYEEAIKTFGMQHQEWKIVEELLELATAIAQCRDKPERCDTKSIIYEIADVYIMLEQLLVILRMNGIGFPSGLVEGAKSEKHERLWKLIEEEKAKQVS